MSKKDKKGADDYTRAFSQIIEGVMEFDTELGSIRRVSPTLQKSNS